MVQHGAFGIRHRESSVYLWLKVHNRQVEEANLIPSSTWFMQTYMEVERGSEVRGRCLVTRWKVSCSEINDTLQLPYKIPSVFLHWRGSQRIRHKSIFSVHMLTSSTSPGLYIFSFHCCTVCIQTTRGFETLRNRAHHVCFCTFFSFLSTSTFSSHYVMAEAIYAHFYQRHFYRR